MFIRPVEHRGAIFNRLVRKIIKNLSSPIHYPGPFLKRETNIEFRLSRGNAGGVEGCINDSPRLDGEITRKPGRNAIGVPATGRIALFPPFLSLVRSEPVTINVFSVLCLPPVPFLVPLPLYRVSLFETLTSRLFAFFRIVREELVSPRVNSCSYVARGSKIWSIETESFIRSHDSTEETDVGRVGKANPVRDDRASPPPFSSIDYYDPIANIHRGGTFVRRRQGTRIFHLEYRETREFYIVYRTNNP